MNPPLCAAGHSSRALGNGDYPLAAPGLAEMPVWSQSSPAFSAFISCWVVLAPPVGLLIPKMMSWRLGGWGGGVC